MSVASHDDDPTDGEIATRLRDWFVELDTADADRERAIVEAIHDLARHVGARMAAAIPQLLQRPFSDDKRIEESICYALYYCVPASIAPLAEHLDHPDARARQRAAHTLRLDWIGVGEQLIPWRTVAGTARRQLRCCQGRSGFCFGTCWRLQAIDRRTPAADGERWLYAQPGIGAARAWQHRRGHAGRRAPGIRQRDRPRRPRQTPTQTSGTRLAMRWNDWTCRPRSAHAASSAFWNEIRPQP